VDKEQGGSGAPVIGFLAARLNETYQYAVWNGAAVEAERLGLSLVFFGGQRLGSPESQEAMDNIVFDLARKCRLSGLIVMANVMGTFVPAGKFTKFLSRFGDIPVVTTGIEYPGFSCVRIENSGGMEAVARHLAEAHGRRSFLFLAGPKGHPESEFRLREFSSCLDGFKGAGVRLQIQGCDFQENMAYTRVGAFFDAGGGADAIVAANDLMALGAMRALKERGIDVPRDVSVTGFDNTDESRFSIPPLTTVHQPTAELGHGAVRRIAAMLGIAKPPVRPPSVAFVVRESCGCPNVAASRPAEDSGARADLRAPAPHQRPSRLGPGEVDTQALGRLAREVNRELRNGRNPAGLRARIGDPALRDRALLIVSEGEARYQALKRLEAEERAAILREIEASLVSSFSLDEIFAQVARGTRALGITGSWLAFFDSPGSPPPRSRLVFSTEGGEARPMGIRGPRFPTGELVPGGLPAGRAAYVCEPLRFGEERIGYMVCTADATDRRVYEALRDQISISLKGAFLMAAERDREKALQREVGKRTAELSKSNELLKREVSRRELLERELLEISNNVMAGIGREIHDNICQDVAGMGVAAAVLEGALRRQGDPNADAAEALVRAAGKAAANARDVARGLYPAELEADGLAEAVKRLAQAAAARGPAQVSVSVEPGFGVADSEKALHAYRIVQEALNNALRHSGAFRVTLSLRTEGESAIVEVRDDGRGFSPSAAGNGGMGLRILKYRAGAVGGRLDVASGPEGTAVVCTIPR
jgi:signal transduction histidine kinase/DNA-binding LacI/PurR family transcriptional regulator